MTEAKSRCVYDVGAMDRVIYLDNNASTPCDPRVVDAMLPFFTDRPANPTSLSHHPGQDGAAVLEDARARVVRLIGGSVPSEVVFTSGATEANNLALIGVAGAVEGRNRHLVSQRTEHASVLEPLASLARRGWEITLVGVDRTGRVRPDAVAEAIRGDTLLVSLMLANNETGTVQPIAEVAAVARERGALVHCDAAQGVGKLAIDVDELGVDLFSLSAHKAHGPKGVGALWVRHRRPPIGLAPVLLGGGQEHGLRSGTPNLPGAVGLARTLELAVQEGSSGRQRLGTLRDRLERRLLEGLDEITVNGDPSHRLPNTTSLVFGGIEAASLLMSLPDVAAATGSACTSSRPEPSPVLRAMGLSRGRASASLRLSVGRFTTEAEIDRAADRIIEEVTRLRALPKRLQR
jgi:cysteine desulfurase